MQGEKAIFQKAAAQKNLTLVSNEKHILRVFSCSFKTSITIVDRGGKTLNNYLSLRFNHICVFSQMAVAFGCAVILIYKRKGCNSFALTKSASMPS